MQIKQITIAITLDDGSLSIMGLLTTARFTIQSDPAWRPLGGGWYQRDATPETIAAEIQRTAFGGGRTATRWRVVDDAQLPTDRTYRAAWADVAGAIVHDLAKARDLHRERIRRVRADKFAALDAAYLRADEAGNVLAKQRIANEKQVLRDLPADPQIENARTIAELKAFWPEPLTKAAEPTGAR